MSGRAQGEGGDAGPAGLRSPARQLITVDGIDGSGKSTWARALAAALGESALLLSVDEFRRPVDWADARRTELDLYYQDRYDLAALDACLAAFLSGAEGGRVPRFDSAREERQGERTLSFAGKRWAVVEGVFVGRLDQAAGSGLSVFVDLPRDEAQRRILARDVATGRPREEVERRIRCRYFPAHDRYLAERDPRQRATLLLDNRQPGRPTLVRGRVPEGPEWQAVRAAVAGLLAP